MSKKNPTARNCSEQEYETACSIGRQSLVTLEVPILDQWPGWWTSSLRASLVSPIQSQGNSAEKQMNETSGPIPYGALARWEPGGFCWRMSQVSFLEMIDGHPMQAPWSDSFPKSGTMRSGVLYPQRTLAHPTNENGGGVLPTKWPTPTATDSSVGHARSPENMVRKDGRNVLRTPSLAETILQENDFPYTKQDLAMKEKGEDYTVSKRHWPTPRVSGQEGYDTRAARKGHDMAMSYLESAVEYHENQANWPTPTASDHKGSGPTIIRKDGRSRMDRLDYVTEQTSEVGGQLNPLWVTWLMGLPVGWVSLAPLSIEEYQGWLVDMTAGTWWNTERDIPRVAQSIPRRVDMLKALGNGIVPEVVAEFLKETSL